LRSAALRGGALTAFGVAVAGAEHDAFPEAADRSPQSNAIVIGDEPLPSPHDARGYAVAHGFHQWMGAPFLVK